MLWALSVPIDATHDLIKDNATADYYLKDKIDQIRFDMDFSSHLSSPLSLK
jgi:hypothetical protein